MLEPSAERHEIVALISSGILSLSMYADPVTIMSVGPSQNDAQMRARCSSDLDETASIVPDRIDG